MIDGRIQLPKRMVVESDAQSYMLNWTSRLDRRNVEIFGYCSVDSETRFILGIHGNYDPTADAFEINAKSARAGDMSMKEPYTTYAHWFLMRHLLLGAGVERMQFHFDIDSMSRMSFLCSFIDEIKERRRTPSTSSTTRTSRLTNAAQSEHG